MGIFETIREQVTVRIVMEIKKSVSDGEKEFHKRADALFRAYSDFYHLLQSWKTDLVPRVRDGPWNFYFTEALKRECRVENVLDTLLHGTRDEIAALLITCKDEYKEIHEIQGKLLSFGGEGENVSGEC